MKKPFLIFASIVLAVVSYAGVISIWAESSVMAAGSTVKLYISPATAGVTTGYTTGLQLRLYKNSSAKVDYAEAHVSFPVSELEVVAVSKQDSYFNNGGSPSISYNNTNGSISFMGSGPALGPVDDVLLATVTFRAKVAGTAAVSYTSASQVGDITNGGHVKNALDSRVGATVNISNPIPAPASAGSSGSNTPVTTASPPPAPATDSAPAAGDTAATPSTQSPASPSSSKDVSTTLERTVTAPPAWLQFLLPAAGGAGLLGMGTLGYVLYLKRRKSGVSLPPEGELGIEVMPSTEAAEAAPLFEIGSESPLASDPAEQSVDEIEPAEAAATVPEALDPIELAEPQPASLESVLAQPAELLPTELRDEAISEVAQSVEPKPAVPAAMATAAEPMVTATESAAPTPFAATSPLPMPAIAAVPVVTPIQPPEQTTVSQPIQYPPEAAIVTPAPVPSVDTAAAEIDYKNLPDMYEVGAQRLQNEGHNDLAAPVSKAQPV